MIRQKFIEACEIAENFLHKKALVSLNKEEFSFYGDSDGGCQIKLTNSLKKYRLIRENLKCWNRKDFDFSLNYHIFKHTEVPYLLGVGGGSYRFLFKYTSEVSQHDLLVIYLRIRGDHMFPLCPSVFHTLFYHTFFLNQVMLLGFFSEGGGVLICCF